MISTWTIKYATEFQELSFDHSWNGTVANVELKGTKGHQSGWIIIAVGLWLWGYDLALMFSNVSGTTSTCLHSRTCNQGLSLGKSCLISSPQSLGTIFESSLGLHGNTPSILRKLKAK